MAHYTIADVNQHPTRLTIEQFRSIANHLASDMEVDMSVSFLDRLEFSGIAIALLDGKLVVFSPSEEVPF